MGFDLDQTIHFFTKSSRGGRQEVAAKPGAEPEQVGKIRRHLATIAAEFERGDFSAPSSIHGRDMPGLAELQRAAREGKLQVIYREVPGGGEIEYLAGDAAVIAAVHSWFDAQLTDHGRHAMPGHMQHGEHPTHSMP